MLTEKKIKVSAPKENPHICYIPEDRKNKISHVKQAYSLSLYKILCTVAHRELSSKESIAAFKSELRKQGWKNIGEWATALVDMLYAHEEKMELSLVQIGKW